MEIHILFGPTATSKTLLAQQLWEKYHYPILSVDSRKVYRDADIGTNKLSLLTFQAIHPEVLIGGIDFLEPNESVSVYLYQQYVYDWLAQHKDEVINAGGLIIHGGTGLYLDAILEGKSLLSSKNEKLREELAPLSIDELQKMASKSNPTAFVNLNESDRKNPRRLIRVIENKGVTPKEFDSDKRVSFFINAKKVWHINIPARPVLHESINKRVYTYYEQGWLAETATLLGKYGVTAPALKMMGYHQLVEFMANHENWQELAKQNTPEFQAVTSAIQQDHRQYAKRQETWAKRYTRKLTEDSSF